MRLSKYTTAFFGATLLSCSIACAQGNFRDGYVITMEKDTLMGEVAFRKNVKNFESCRFLKNQEIQDFGPDEIAGFGYVNFKFFTSEIIPGQFAEVLIKGKLSLYRVEEGFYLEKDGELHYISKTPEKIPQSVQIEPGQKLLDDNRWRQTLSSQIGDCDEAALREKVSRIKYGEQGISGIVLAYNNCDGQGDYQVFKANEKFVRFDWGVSLDLANSRVKIVGEKFNSGLRPVPGIHGQVAFPRTNDRLALVGDVLFAQGVYEVMLGQVAFLEEGGTIIEQIEDELRMSNLTFQYGVRYNQQFREFALGWGAGLYTAFLLNANGEWKDELENRYPGVWVSLSSTIAVGRAKFEFGIRHLRSPFVAGTTPIASPEVNDFASLLYDRTSLMLKVFLPRIKGK